MFNTKEQIVSAFTYKVEIHIIKLQFLQGFVQSLRDIFRIMNITPIRDQE